MKAKTISILLVITALLCLASCGRTQTVNTSKSSSATDESIEEAQSVTEKQKIDVDLTKMSSTMIYSKVYDMLNNPEDYVGKLIKMKGSFAAYEGGDYRDYYFACVIADAAACCQQGIEFRTAEDLIYPEEYPKTGKEITVVGTFATYMEGDQQYAELQNSSISY